MAVEENVQGDNVRGHARAAHGGIEGDSGIEAARFGEGREDEVEGES